MKLFTNLFAFLTVAMVVTSCGNKTDNTNQPVFTPFRGYWTVDNRIDFLNFADVRIDGSSIIVYGPLPSATTKVAKVQGTQVLKKEVSEGVFTIVNQREVKLPNGTWQMAEFNVEWKLSSCVGVKPVAKKTTIQVAWLLTDKDDAEQQYTHMYFGDPAKDNLHFNRYNETETSSDYAKVQEVVRGCYKDDGSFAPTTSMGTIP